jgi:hypothetical protein
LHEITALAREPGPPKDVARLDLLQGAVHRVERELRALRLLRRMNIQIGLDPLAIIAPGVLYGPVDHDRAVEPLLDQEQQLIELSECRLDPRFIVRFQSSMYYLPEDRSAGEIGPRM